ncbi:unnamed protein product, partial [Urochloa humidicola]
HDYYIQIPLFSIYDKRIITKIDKTWKKTDESRTDICCQYEVQNPRVLLAGVNRAKYSFQLQKYGVLHSSTTSNNSNIHLRTTIVSPKLSSLI